MADSAKSVQSVIGQAPPESTVPDAQMGSPAADGQIAMTGATTPTDTTPASTASAPRVDPNAPEADDDAEPVSFTDFGSTARKKKGKKKKRVKKSKGSKKGKKNKKTKTKYAYVPDRFESDLYMMRLEGTLFCAGISTAVLLIASISVVCIICAVWSAGQDDPLMARFN